MEKIDSWAWIASLLIIVSAFAFAIVWVAIHGGKMKLGKLFGLDSEKEASPSRLPESVISDYRGGKYKELREYFKTEVRIQKAVLCTHFRFLFINYLKQCCGYGAGVESHEHVHLYVDVLNIALDTVYEPLTKKVIFKNHWPVKGESPHENESEEDFRKRFLHEITLPNTHTVMQLTKNKITDSWKYLSSVGIDRLKYINEYVDEKETLQYVINNSHALFLKCYDQKEYNEKIIENHDGTTPKRQKEEWGIMYG